MCAECSFKLKSFSDFRDKAFKTEINLLSKIDENKAEASIFI